MNDGIQPRGGLRSEQGRKRLEQLPLAPWATRRRKDLHDLLDRLNETLEELSAAVQQERRKRPEVRPLMANPWSRACDGARFCAHRGIPGAFSMWKANREVM
jgi:hypothetical protein